MAIYNRVTKYKVDVKATSPIHVGNGEGQNTVLKQPGTGIPFVQGTSIAGAFRSFVCDNYPEKEELFGDSKSDKKSNIVFSDLLFNKNTVKTELRTRVSLDGSTGTVQSKEYKDKTGSSGQLFDIELVSEGAEGTFTIYVFSNGEECDDTIEKAFAGIENNDILFGGQNSNGCGRFTIIQTLKWQFDLTSDDGRKAWLMETEDDIKTAKDITSDVMEITNTLSSNKITIIVEASFDDTVLVKGDYVDEAVLEEAFKVDYKNSKTNIPDNMPLINGNKDFIISSSSIKGAVRNRIEMIIDWLGIDEKMKEEIFEGKPVIDFYDAVIDGDLIEKRRIAIDKFIGGVRSNMMMSQVMIAGKTSIKIDVDSDKNQYAFPLLMYSLRDMAMGEYALGGQNSIGAGTVSVKSIIVYRGKKELLTIDYSKNEINDKAGILADGMKKLKEVAK